MRTLKFDLKDIIKNAELKRQEQIKDFKANSKNLYELLIFENFKINEVNSQIYTTNCTPNSNIIFNCIKPMSYHSGFTPKLTLKVTPNDKYNPIRTLIFEGISPVKAGDYISAQIPRYEEKKVSANFYSGPFNKELVFYFDREFNQEESAIELVLISEDGNILRRDKAINYDGFFKK